MNTPIASLFTAACFAIFLQPLVGSINFVIDHNARYWIGRWPLLVIYLPVLYIVTFFVHLIRKGKPSRIFIILSIVLSCVTFVAVGVSVYVRTTALAGVMDSTSCPNSGLTSPLESVKIEATKLYACCLKKNGDLSLDSECNDNSIATPTTQQHSNILIQDCADYGDLYNSKKTELEYLAWLQKTKFCTGFCQPSVRPLFVHQVVNDIACGQVVSSYLEHWIGYSALEMIVYSCFVAVLFSIWIGVINKPLKLASGEAAATEKLLNTIRRNSRPGPGQGGGTRAAPPQQQQGSPREFAPPPRQAQPQYPSAGAPPPQPGPGQGPPGGGMRADAYYR
uniref:Tetraspanin n=1 Tax=Chromera velia CCMP2878 TaxID=1169474 RepID=A0A0G4GHQ7_9ALVE|eukprot:Cvel_21923.t1-p1 / transcript=Cvel_21923.t1 / gene=Cvel_21923 / organism=Chromera_velia_CCMP2878 / gene_product=hypothetical protein / transcript_product=hypothetical protein / location=Cvel_scaffold2102:14385-16686(+) / protein_length=335 / sequence_SO=supercontig / SO=protein_coding / is_pseudo=false